MEGMSKGKNTMVALSPIFIRLTAIENGGTSLYRGNPDLIRVALTIYFDVKTTDSFT